MARLLGVTTALLVVAGCSGPKLAAGLPCADSGACPPGQVCGAGLVCVAADDYQPAGGADLVFLDFSPAGGAVMRNLVGNGWEFDESAMTIDEGIVGAALEFPDDWMDVERGPTPALFPDSAMTIEMWVRPESLEGERPLFGDFSESRTPEASYYLFLEDGGTLGFASNQGCTVDRRVLDPSGVRLEAGQWAHVAFSWDGTRAVFFVDGEPSPAQELDIVPCYVGEEELRIGRRSDAQLHFVGAIDEFKLSSYAKGAADIEASMSYDSSVPACGNGRLEAGEDCDGVGLCCDLETCQNRDGESCGDGMSCDGVLCRGSAERTLEGIAARYLFDEAGGDIVFDSSGLAPAIDLTIDDIDLATWSVDGLTVEGTFAASTGSTADLTAACRASREITIEAWVTPLEGGNHDDIVCYADGDDELFELEHEDDAYQAQFGTTRSVDSSKPEIGTPTGDVVEERTHVAVTRDADGERVIYVNGVPRSRSLDVGDFSEWSEQTLFLGRDGDGDFWEGTYHYVAIYCRALSEIEVARAFVAGE